MPLERGDHVRAQLLHALGGERFGDPAADGLAGAPAVALERETFEEDDPQLAVQQRHRNLGGAGDELPQAAFGRPRALRRTARGKDGGERGRGDKREQCGGHGVSAARSASRVSANARSRPVSSAGSTAPTCSKPCASVAMKVAPMFWQLPLSLCAARRTPRRRRVRAGAQLVEQRRRAVEEQGHELVDDVRVVVAEDAHAGASTRASPGSAVTAGAVRAPAAAVPSQRSSTSSSSSGRSGLER